MPRLGVFGGIPDLVPHTRQAISSMKEAAKASVFETLHQRRNLDRGEL